MAEERRETIIELDDKTYELKYNLKTIKRIETISQTSLMGILTKNNGMLSIGDAENYFKHALFNGEGKKVSSEQGAEVFEKLLESTSYSNIIQLIILQLQHDVPFFFQTDSTD